MNLLRSKLMVAAVLLAVALPLASFARPHQKHGRGHGKKAERFFRDRDDCRGCWERRDERRLGRDKKADKFINGHDACDGRWDGRVPRAGERRLPPPRWRIR